MRETTLPAIAMAVLAVVLLVATLGATATQHERAELEATGSLEDVDVENGTVTSLTVTVTNTGDDSISPILRVWSSNWDIQSEWDSDAERLEPGETATFVLTPPGESEKLPPDVGARFVVQIGDSGRQAWTVLGPYEVSADAAT